jgi:hypothetical protein
MGEAIPPLLQYVFMAWCSVKHRDNFTFQECSEKFLKNEANAVNIYSI